MATIELSSGFLTSGFLQNFSQLYNPYGSYAPATNGIFSGYNGFISQISIFKGTIPVSPTTDSISTRAADILVTWYRWGNGVVNTVTIDYSANPLKFNFTPANSTASGTASWFMLQTANIAHRIIGSVGITGSGADLEMSNTNVIINQQYQVSQLKMIVPFSWTY